jgi:hypothetical protein
MCQCHMLSHSAAHIPGTSGAECPSILDAVLAVNIHDPHHHTLTRPEAWVKISLRKSDHVSFLVGFDYKP